MAIVVTINELVDFANVNNDLTMILSNPVVSKTAPKVSAHITSQIVFNMLDIPPRVNNASTTSTPLLNENPE